MQINQILESKRESNKLLRESLESVYATHIFNLSRYIMVMNEVIEKCNMLKHSFIKMKIQ